MIVTYPKAFEAWYARHGDLSSAQWQIGQYKRSLFLAWKAGRNYERKKEMNKEQTVDASRVMLAQASGAVIERRTRTGSDGLINPWQIVDIPSWNWTDFDYRIRPQKPEYVWISFNEDSTPESYITTHISTKGMTRYRKDE